jgi:hypothetical protein
MATSKTATKSSAKVTEGRVADAPEVIKVNSVKYKVIETFKDVDGNIYVTGDAYPAENAKINKERYHALLTNENKVKRPFITEELEG